VGDEGALRASSEGERWWESEGERRAKTRGGASGDLSVVSTR
jgi:hypothetical protein